ncbi:hypothetical protein M2251_002377 [Rhodococcus erythropolis]|nr:hypothetical protein [Rhodococcus erythropolis]
MRDQYVVGAHSPCLVHGLMVVMVRRPARVADRAHFPTVGSGMAALDTCTTLRDPDDPHHSAGQGRRGPREYETERFLHPN